MLLKVVFLKKKSSSLRLIFTRELSPLLSELEKEVFYLPQIFRVKEESKIISGCISFDPVILDDETELKLRTTTFVKDTRVFLPLAKIYFRVTSLHRGSTKQFKSKIFPNYYFIKSLILFIPLNETALYKNRFNKYSKNLVIVVVLLLLLIVARYWLLTSTWHTPEI